MAKRGTYRKGDRRGGGKPRRCLLCGRRIVARYPGYCSRCRRTVAGEYAGPTDRSHVGAARKPLEGP